MNMEFCMQIDDEHTYKLRNKHNYCFKSGIRKYFVVLILIFCKTDKFNKT